MLYRRLKETKSVIFQELKNKKTKYYSLTIRFLIWFVQTLTILKQVGKPEKFSCVTHGYYKLLITLRKKMPCESVFSRTRYGPKLKFMPGVLALVANQNDVIYLRAIAVHYG